MKDELIERPYLIRKGGYWYRPNSQGYTPCARQAGRYTLAEAIDLSHPNGPDGPRDGIDYVHEKDLPPEAAQQGEADNARIAELEAALRPFAKLAGPINGEVGRPTYLEAISGPNGTDELELRTFVGDGTRVEIMDAGDFRRAARALTQEATNAE